MTNEVHPYRAFIVLLDNRILHWGIGDFPANAPNRHVEAEYFSAGTYERLKKFSQGRSPGPPLRPRKRGITIRHCKVRSMTEFKEIYSAYQLHPNFSGLDLAGGRLIEKQGPRRKKRTNEQDSAS